MTDDQTTNGTQMLDEIIEQDVSTLFKALSNPTRIKILFALKQKSIIRYRNYTYT